MILGGSNKSAKIALLKVIVSYVLNTGIPVFALMKSSQPTFHLVNRQEFSVPSDYQVKRNLPLSSSNESGFFRRHKKGIRIFGIPLQIANDIVEASTKLWALTPFIIQQHIYSTLNLSLIHI